MNLKILKKIIKTWNCHTFDNLALAYKYPPAITHAQCDFLVIPRPAARLFAMLKCIKKRVFGTNPPSMNGFWCYAIWKRHYDPEHIYRIGLDSIKRVTDAAESEWDSMTPEQKRQWKIYAVQIRRNSDLGGRYKHFDTVYKKALHEQKILGPYQAPDHPVNAQVKTNRMWRDSATGKIANYLQNRGDLPLPTDVQTRIFLDTVERERRENAAAEENAKNYTIIDQDQEMTSLDE